MNTNLKIVYIGGGSVNWGPKLACDLFSTPSLRNSRLVMVDINPEHLSVMHQYCSELAKRLNTGWQVETADLDTALDHADSVIVSISTGGLDTMQAEYSLAEKYGVYHSVGDTVGPGGISRTLRNVPVFLDLARRMEKLCPGAWMVHVTNPLAQLTRAVSRKTGVRTVGLCHNWHGTRTFLAKYFGCETKEIDAVSVGVNHFTWLKDITCRDRPIAAAELSVDNYLQYEARQQGKPLITNTTDDAIEAALGGECGANYLLNFQLFESLGVFPVGAPSHVAENFSFYLSSDEIAKKHRIRRKGVIPHRANYMANSRQGVMDILEGRKPYPVSSASNEEVAAVVDSLCTGSTHRCMVNLPNTGQIGNIARGVVVETGASAASGTITPLECGDVPLEVNGFVQSIVAEEELTIQAVLSGRRDDLVRALMASPLLFDKDRVVELADDIRAINRPYMTHI